MIATNLISICCVYKEKIVKNDLHRNINYVRMRRKIIDDYCLQYLNDLFGIKLICDPSSMSHLSEFVWTLGSSVLVVFNNFLLIRRNRYSNINSNQKSLFFVASLYPFSFFENTPFKIRIFQSLINANFKKLTKKIIDSNYMALVMQGVSYTAF